MDCYVRSLAGGVVGGVPHIFGGDSDGLLFRGDALTQEVNLRQRRQAHRGAIPVLTLRETPQRCVLVSGGHDGWVRFWTPDLEQLLEIDVRQPVTSLSWLGNELANATDGGVLCVTVR